MEFGNRAGPVAKCSAFVRRNGSSDASACFSAEFVNRKETTMVSLTIRRNPKNNAMVVRLVIGKLAITIEYPPGPVALADRVG